MSALLQVAKDALEFLEDDREKRRGDPLDHGVHFCAKCEGAPVPWDEMPRCLMCRLREAIDQAENESRADGLKAATPSTNPDQVRDAKGKVVAYIPSRFAGDGDNGNPAHLIAAAPWLLELAEDIAILSDPDFVAPVYVPHEELAGAIRKLGNKARAAITKARGTK